MSTSGRTDFCVSYHEADRAWADWIARRLTAAGYTAVLRVREVPARIGDARAPSHACGEAARTVALLSPDYPADRLPAEGAEAAAGDPTGGRGRPILVRVRACDAEGFLDRFGYVDLVGLDEAAAAAALIAGVERRPVEPSTVPGFPGAPDLTSLEPPRFPGGSDAPPSAAAGQDAGSLAGRKHEHPRRSPLVAAVTGAGALVGLAVAGRFRNVPHYVKQIVAFATGAGAIVGLAAGLIELRPNSDGGASAGTLVKDEIEIVDRALALGDYCRRRGLSCEGEADLEWPGHVISFTIETEGNTGTELPLKWSLYDAKAGERVPEPEFNDQDGWPDGVYVPAKSRDRNSGELWIPLPPRAGTYFVRIELYPSQVAGRTLDDDALLDAENTPSFEVSAPGRENRPARRIGLVGGRVWEDRG